MELTLSQRRLFPHLKISFAEKAPAFANIDDVKGKLEKHFGRIFETQSDFAKVLADEEALAPVGVKIRDFTLANGRQCTLNKICLDDESFHEQSFYLQSLLPFFVDGASPIEPSPFWKYFIIYDAKTSHLLAFATVFEGHITAVKYRAKISQVLVLPPY